MPGCLERHLRLRHALRRSSGGSAANVMKCLAGLSGCGEGGSDGGVRCVRFVGMVGHDAAGEEYCQRLTESGVEPHLLRPLPGSVEAGMPSAKCLCMVRCQGCALHERTVWACMSDVPRPVPERLSRLLPHAALDLSRSRRGASAR